MHRDLKSPNLLVDTDWSVKVRALGCGSWALYVFEVCALMSWVLQTSVGWDAMCAQTVGSANCVCQNML